MFERFRRGERLPGHAGATEPTDSGTPADIPGERGIPSVNARSLSRRISHRGGLVLGAAAIALILYNATTADTPTTPPAKKTSLPDRVENVLPPLELPAPSRPPPPKVPSVLGSAPGFEGTAAPREPGAPSADDLWQKRRLSSPVMALADRAGDTGRGYAGAEGGPVTLNPAAGAPIPASAGASLSGASRDDELAARLRPTRTAEAQAAFLPDRDFLVPKGAFIDCVLETRLVSTVPGMTRCVVSRDVYSDNGRVVLLERGSVITGQYRGGLQQGQARIFVLWDRARTPHGVVIDLASPGADALGGAGHEGEIDTHFWTRFGGAILLSLIDDALVVASQSAGSGNTTVVLPPATTGAARNAAAEALRNTINVPPTLYKNQGDAITVYVARDLDFRGVYALRSRDQP